MNAIVWRVEGRLKYHSTVAIMPNAMAPRVTHMLPVVKPHWYKKKSGKKITNDTTHTRGEKLKSCMCYPDAAGLNGVPVQTLAHAEAHLVNFRKPGRP